MTRNQNFYKKLAVEAARIADSKKAENIEIYDAGGKNSLFYYTMLATAESAPQISAIEQEILFQLKREGAYSLHKDGMQSKSWKVLDYGGLVVHIFETQTREFYSLDRVYLDCKKVEWRNRASGSTGAGSSTSGREKPVKKVSPPQKNAAKKKKTVVKKPKKDRRKKK